MDEEETLTGAEPIDADPQLILDKVDTWLDGLFALLPNIAVALVIFAIFIAIGLAVSWSFRKTMARRDREDLGSVTGSLFKWGLWIAGGMLALTIVIPSLKPADLIAGLGLGSVAIGFAFKDILQNMLAGLLILIRQPFRVGDQIVAGDYEGTVEHIETRATLIKTYDGRRVVIPNSDVYTAAVTVNTAWDIRRSEYDFGIHYDADTFFAMQVALDAVRAVEGVRNDPDPEALSMNLGDFAKSVRVRWWTESTQRETIHVYSDVMLAVEKAFAENDIGIPFPTSTLHLDGELQTGREMRQAAE
ncbi:mechanosensitive ion channel family protein [Jannaschia sp.]|nr:mechanosensitive ion channel family protein [Jannaschia sp.]